MEIVCPKCEAINDCPGQFCARCGAQLIEAAKPNIESTYGLLLFAMAFYSCLAAFLIYSDKYGKEMMLGAYAFVAYIWWRNRREPEWVDKAPPFVQGLFAFLLLLFFPMTIAVIIILFALLAATDRGF